jgi:hypothetical protein
MINCEMAVSSPASANIRLQTDGPLNRALTSAIWSMPLVQ